MPDAVDFVIVGSTPFAALLAGSLTSTHGKRVVRIGRRPSAQRLPRRLDLALPLATRPATWEILVRGATETRTLLEAIGIAEALSPIEVMVRAGTEASAAALSHIAHLAAAYGLKPRRRDDGWVFRGVPLLRAERIEDKVGDWLSGARVRSLDPDDARPHWDGSGIMTFGSGDEAIEARQVVLADDAAILDLPEAQRPSGLIADAITATLLARPKPLPAPVLLAADAGVTLMQRPDGNVLGLVTGESEIEARLASVLSGPFPVAHLATGRSRRIVTHDGAPVLGSLGESNVQVVAGLGDAAVFYATAIARVLAGADSDAERGWFAAHAPVAPRESIAEFVA